jgi:predicted Zn finger-like uncharacterized protein
MITHCPYCLTHFRVHAEQLAARAGQARCGKCNRVFDALEHLIEEAAPPRENAAMLAAAAAVPVSAPAPAENVSSGVPEPAIAATPTRDLDFGAGVAEPAIAAIPDIDIRAETMTARSGLSETATPGGTFDFGPMATAEPAGRARRWPWLIGALLLLLLLLVQAAYLYRSAILVLFPQARPYAVALCATLGCELPLPRHIELMSIEASDLHADTTNPTIMVLSATLKNRAIFDQQFPMIELTLTDSQDQPVVRRVLAPPDYLGKAASARAGFTANSETAIKVFIEGSQVKATGYRLYLFYP